MATWTVELEVENLPAKHANVKGIRTDGVDIREFTLGRVSLDTHDKPGAQIRQEIGDAIWAAYQDDIIDRSAIADLLAGYEAALATDLNGMEP